MVDNTKAPLEAPLCYLEIFLFFSILQSCLPGLIYICAKEGAETATKAAPTVKMTVIINSFIFNLPQRWAVNTIYGDAVVISISILLFI